MTRRRDDDRVSAPDGVLVVDKSSGPSSHDIVIAVRRMLGTSRVGHTGTLDPLATGVLPLVIGRATRLAQFLSPGRKAYRATLRFGFSTETDDALGAASSSARHPPPSRETVLAALERFRGPFLQQPPLFSAKKVDGTRAYEMARAHQKPTLTATPVEVFRLELLATRDDTCVLDVECSTGFYVRALARDLGEALGCGAHLTALRRLQSGEFTLEQAVTVSDLAELVDRRARVIPLSSLLTWLPAAELDQRGIERVAHGSSIPPALVARWVVPAATSGPWTAPADAIAGFVRLTSQDGALLAIARSIAEPGHTRDQRPPLQPLVVLV